MKTQMKCDSYSLKPYMLISNNVCLQSNYHTRNLPYLIGSVKKVQKLVSKQRKICKRYKETGDAFCMTKYKSKRRNTRKEVRL